MEGVGSAQLPISLGLEPSSRALKIPPVVFRDVKNCWYHYYSQGSQRQVRYPRDIDFALASYKQTPDFFRLLYNFEICHWQIGDVVTEGKSLVVMKTSVGVANLPLGYTRTKTYITGFFRVQTVEDGYIVMDPKESLLLLSDPIEITPELAKTLFPGKESEYWKNDKRTLAAKLGSITRNKYLGPPQAEWIINELVRRYNKGVEDYLGPRYLQLIQAQVKDLRLDKWLTREPLIPRGHDRVQTSSSSSRKD